ncbi:MAG: hypothetical protein H0U42_01840 [Thermoleophilaceae bacterium]|nr:hypothetical protein [Thermoleophilaceae bacterium]
MRSGRLTTSIRRRGARLEDHQLALGLGLVLIGLFLSYVSIAAVNGVPFQDGYRIKAVLPSETPALKPSDAIRIGGERVGSVKLVEYTPEGTVATLELAPEDAPVGRDAELFVRLRSASYLYYVDLDPGDRSDPLPEGGTIAADRVDFGTDPLEIARAFNRDTQRAFKRSVTAFGFGLQGRGADLNRGVGDLEPALRQGTPLLEAAVPREGEPGDFVRGTQRTFSGIAGERPDDIEGLIAATRRSLGTIAGRREELGATIDLVPPLSDELRSTLPVVDPLLEDADRLAVRLTPTLGDLDRLLPDVNRLLRVGDQLRSESRELTARLDPALELADPVLRALYPGAASLLPAIEPVRPVADELAQYDREIRLFGEGAVSVTDNRPETGAAPGQPAVRFAPILTCATEREPFPKPREALGQRSGKSPLECLK